MDMTVPILLADMPSRDGWTVVAILGDDYEDPRYGRFSISREMAESWVRNLHLGVVTGQPRVAVDYAHAEDDQDAAGAAKLAAGWITDLRIDGSDVLARITWTPRAREAISAGEWAFFSPSFVEHYRDERGVDRGATMVGGGICNRPVLKGTTLVATLAQQRAAALERRVQTLTATPFPATPTSPVPAARSAGAVVWGAGSEYGGDVDASRNPDRVHEGRAQLDAQVRLEMARAGDDDYSGALTRTLAAAAAGAITLSAGAREGLGIAAPQRGGWRDQADVPTDPERDARWRDSAAFCASRRPGAEPDAPVGDGVGRVSAALERRAEAIRQLAQATGESVDEVVRRLAHEV